MGDGLVKMVEVVKVMEAVKMIWVTGMVGLW